MLCPRLKLPQVEISILDINFDDHFIAPVWNFWNWGKILSWNTRSSAASDWGTRSSNFKFALTSNWGKIKVGVTGAPTWPMPQFKVRAKTKLKSPVLQLGRCPNLKLGQNQN